MNRQESKPIDDRQADCFIDGHTDREKADRKLDQLASSQAGRKTETENCWSHLKDKQTSYKTDY